jgi:hypothetical protein
VTAGGRRRTIAAVQLEIHVGPLTAFFGPAVRAEAARAGAPAPDLAEVRARIVAWRTWIADGLRRAGHLERPLDWDEAAEAPAERLLLPADALRALKLLLAIGSLDRAPALLPERPELDPRWIAEAEAGFAEHPYPQLMVPEFWLPGDFDFTFACPWPDGHEVQTGSVGALAGQLARVRESLLGGTPFDVLVWAQEIEPTRALAPLARHAVGVLEQAVARALERGQPILWAPADRG